MTKLEEIKSKLDIVDVIGDEVELSKKGQNYWGVCPFHDDTSPSMSISPTKQIFKCFVCGAGGDAIKFVSDYKKIPFKKAMQILAKRANVNFSYYDETSEFVYKNNEQNLIKAMKDAKMFFENSLFTKIGKNAFSYLESRKIDATLATEFGLGYAPNDNLIIDFLVKSGHDKADLINLSLMNENGSSFFRNRLIVPIHNEFGDVVAFSGRVLTDQNTSKYINSKESIIFSKSKIMYNYDKALDIIKKERKIYVVEGYMDVIALHKIGIKNTVAIMGTAMTSKHIELLKGSDVILLLDGDDAGIKAAIKSSMELLKNKIKTYVVSLPKNKDVSDLVEENHEDLITLIDSKSTILDFIFEKHNILYADVTPESNEMYLNSMAKYLQNASLVETDFYTNKISEIRKISIDVVKSKIKPKRKVDTEDIFAKKEKENNLKKKIIEKFRKKNYEYEMIHSMLISKTFISLYEEKNPIQSDATILQIGKYLIQYTKNEITRMPSSFMKLKIAEIKRNSNFVTTKEEFLELMRRVSKNSLKLEIADNEIKLRNTKDPNESLRLLEIKKKLKKKLKEF